MPSPAGGGKEGVGLLRSAFLVYRIVRAPLGLSFGFVIMYGAFISNFSPALLLSALALFLTELFGAVYNDFCDHEEDMRNKKTDKMILSGMLSRQRMLHIAVAVAAAALVISAAASAFVLMLAVYCLVIYAFYSNPKVRLKGHLSGYAVSASLFLFFPFALDVTLHRVYSISTVVFALFFFFQVMYILCQKDSTDPRDKKNLFVTNGWSFGFASAAFFGTLASASLLFAAAGSGSVSPPVAAVWLFNAFSKGYNLERIFSRKITRSMRHVLVLFEFLTPYLYALAVAL
jgi:4-hydroxybenzoate polyprenyltransferase